MKQTGLSGVLKSFLAVAFLSLFTLAATSCDNFLQAGDLKQKLDEAIEIANSSSVTYFIEPVNANGNITGTVNPSSVLVRKKDTFEVIYKPTGNYQFEKWEVLDRKTRKPVLDSLSFENVNAPETKVTVINPKEGLIIHPKCILQPAVEQIIPNPSGQNQISSIIKIKFNMPVDDSVIAKVRLFYLGIDMAPYFESPTLNDKKDTLYLRAKTKEMLAFIKNLEKSAVDINVYIPDSITVKIEGKDVPLKQDSNSNFVFHYVVVADTTAPQSLDFFLSREYRAPGTDVSTVTKMHEEIALQTEDQTASDFYNNIAEPKKQDYLDNLCGPYVYIYGKLRDDESGISKVNIFEQYCGHRSDEFKHIGKIEQSKQYNADDEYNLDEDETGTWFYTDVDGTTYFCIKHYIKAQNGAVRISANASDAYEHTVQLSSEGTKKQEITVFKQGNIVFEGWYLIENTYYPGGSDPFPNTKKQFNSNIKTIWFHNDESDQLFMPYTYIQIPVEYHTITCEYKHKDGEIRPDVLTLTDDYEWKLVLDVDKVSGLHLKFTIKDILGNVSVKEYSIPKSEDYIGYQIPDATNPDKAQVYFLYNTGEFACEPVPVTDKGNGKIEIDDWTPGEFEAEIESGITYQFIPSVGFEFDGYPVVKFYTEIPEYYYSIKGAPSGTINTQNFEDTSKPYKMSINSKNELLDITVKIADDSWTKGYSEILLYAEDKGFIMGQYNKELNDFGSIQEGDKIEAFNYGKTECTITCLTQLMYESATNLYVYGVKNGVCSQKTKVEIPQLLETDIDYDNCIISHVYADTNKIKSETVTIPFKDDQTGIDTRYTYIFEGNDVLNIYGTDIKKIIGRIIGNGRFGYSSLTTGTLYERSIEIPRWFYTDSGFTWFIVDKAGNVRYGIRNPNVSEQLFKITGFNKTTDSITINAQRVKWPESVQTKKIVFYEWDTSENKWGEEKSKVCSNYLNLSLTKNTDYTENKFIKVVLDTEKNDPEQRYSFPAYVYTGTSNKGNNDYAYPPFDGSIAITSDAPVFVRTLVTTASFEECENWTAEQWEDGKKCIRESYLACSASQNLQVYKIIDPYNCRGIDHARCYAIILHFANGRRAKAGTFKNPSYLNEP